MRRLVIFMLLAALVLGVGFHLHKRNIAPVPVTAADLAPGGAYGAEERAALRAACAVQIKTDVDTVCSCVADKAAGEASRFDRLVMTATFQQRLVDVVALSKGLVATGIARAELEKIEDASRARVKAIMKACRAG